MDIRDWLISLYSFAFLVGLILGVIFLWKGNSRRSEFMGYFQIAICIWTLGELLGSLSTTIETNILWNRVAYIGITASPILYFAFALEFAQIYRWLTKKVILLLSLIPFITFLLVQTNEYHHLYWKEISLDTELGIFNYEPGIVSWIFTFYTYTILAIGLFAIFYGLFRFPKVYKKQIILLIFASCIPIVINVIYVFNLNPSYNVDWTPVGLMLAGALVSILMVRHKIFDIIPIATEHVFKVMKDPMVVVDIHNRVIHTNPAFERVFAKDKEFKIGSNLTLYVKDSSFNCNRNSNEYKHDNRYYDVRCSSLFSSNGKKMGTIIIYRDISVRKQSEEALYHTNDKLKDEIAKHEQIISDLEAFSRSVAHDLKNPLSNIMNFIELIQFSVYDTAKVEEYAKSMKELTDNMSSIIDNLLKLASVRHKDIVLDKIDMESNVDFAIQRLTHQIYQTNATIIKPSSWPNVYGYGPWIEEVWMNYISNAIKYGGQPPYIRLGYENLENDFIRFFIQDNGDGLSKKNQSLVFDEFTRLDTTKDGHGLGLSIVKKIIEKHNGNTGVFSDNMDGRGCKFYFDLKKFNT